MVKSTEYSNPLSLSQSIGKKFAQCLCMPWCCSKLYCYSHRRHHAMKEESEGLQDQL